MEWHKSIDSRLFLFKTGKLIVRPTTSTISRPTQIIGSVVPPAGPTISTPGKLRVIAPTKFENCLLAPMKFGKLLTAAPTRFVTASYASTHKLKFLRHAFLKHIESKGRGKLTGAFHKILTLDYSFT